MNKTIKILSKIYLLVLTIFSVFRLILFLTETSRFEADNTVSIITIIYAFIMGVRFDIVISGYILFFPAIILFITEILNRNDKHIFKGVFYWIFFLFSVSFIIAAADIPYFNQFFERFSIGAFEWFDNIGFIFSMILQEPKYFLIIVPFIILDIFFFFLLKKIFNAQYVTNKNNMWINSLISILFLAIMFLGIRGRIEKKSPIRIGTAYFCENAFLNKLGLNPVFTLMRSYIDSKDSKNKTINLIDNKIAQEKIKKYLNIKNLKYNSPIARKVIPDTISNNKPNVVIVIMESMSAAKMEYFGNTNHLTPLLDSLAHNSLFFDNFYSAGKHTFNGVFSTLFSFPALYRQHTMKKIRKYNGISAILKEYGYTTTYFTTHDGQFDNVEGFLRANDFENIITQSEYPFSEVKTTLGVPDDFMFRFSIPKINEIAKNGKPFFVTFMTASDHGPYYIPEYFKPKNKDIKQQIVEYADWSLQKFITLSSQQKWFDNTIFVFVADHGAAINTVYEVPLNYFHIPLIIYSPKLIKSKIIKSIGSQIDVSPTIMGLLKYSYVNNTLGIDLLKQKRKYAILNDDNKIGIIDTSYFCIMKDYGKEIELFKYKNHNRANLYSDNKKKADDMVMFAKVNLQVTQEMILKKQTTLYNKSNR